MLRNKNLLVFFSLGILMLGACSRQADKKPLTDAARLVIGPSNQDVMLTLPKTGLQVSEKNLNLEPGAMETAEYFRLVDDLKTLSTQKSNEQIEALAREMYNAFYRDGATYTKNNFSRFYMEAILGEAQPEAQKQLSVIARDISVAKQKLSQLLTDSASSYDWPKEITHLSQAVVAADTYVNWLMKAIPRLGLNAELTRPITAAIRTEFFRYRPGFAEMATSLEEAKDVGQAVKAVKRALTKFDVKLPAEQSALLVKADNLVKLLDTMESSQEALTLLVEVWRLVPPASREAVFKPVVPELYDFFNGKSELSMDCLAASICLNPVLEVARRIAILPKISDYGVKKIHDQVEEAAKDYIVKAVRLEAAKLIPQIPVQARNNIVVEAEKYQVLIASIQADFPKFGRTRAAAWGAKEFSQELRGFEAGNVHVKIGGKGQIAVKPLTTVSNRVSTGAETLGLSLSLSHEFLPKSGTRLKAALVEPILKLLAMGGFQQLSGKQFPALLLPMDGQPGDEFKITQLMKGATSFAVPDTFVGNPDFFADRANAKKNASVGAQAELLRGIARQVKFHRDWEKNVFDEELSVIQVEDVAPEIPKGAVDLSIFPKDLIFALSLGNAGGMLQNIVRGSSPAFLLLPNGELLWGDRYKEIAEGKVSTVAGLVSIENGVRGKTVRTAEIARYVLALDEFLDATEGVEQTRSKPLLATDDEGKRLIDQLADARRYLRLFQMGLTNFLVSVAQQKDGSIVGEFTLEKGRLEKVATPLSLEDHALTVRALLASSRGLEMPIFRWSALDAFYFMNKRFWDPKRQFYAAQDPTAGKARAVTLRELTLTLVSLNELAPHMNSESRRQWEKVSSPWIRALEDF